MKMMGKILFVDDEIHILKSLKRLFREEPYEVLTTSSPLEALEVLEEHEVPVVVSDQRMPEMEGTVLLRQVKEKWPDTVRMILTGYADLDAAVAAINQGSVYRFISKPWDDTELKLAVRNAFEHYQLVADNKKLFELTVNQNMELVDLNQNLEKKVEERTEEIRGLLQRLEKSFQELIRVFIEVMELFNPALGGHAKRVNEIAEKIARQYGLSEEQVHLIKQSALLHDIGLVGLPRSLLENEEETYGKAELALIQQHPTLGHMTLNKIEDLKEVSTIVKEHHENFNGSGYPEGLRGEKISLEARILHVADDCDHFMNKKNMPLQEALEALKRKSGLEYDPQVVVTLLGIHDQLHPSTENEVAFWLEDLQPGTVLSRDIRTHTGLFLIAKHTQIEKPHLERLSNFHRIYPIVDRIYVYKASIKKAGARLAT